MKQAPSEAPSAQGLRVAVLYSDFNPRVVQGLLEGAVGALSAMNAAQVREEKVPGAFELPLAAKAAAIAGFDAVIALGAVIRGETDHYDYVCAEAARGIQDVQLRTGVPCSFGVLTVESMDQALARTGGGKRDQGEHAAQAVLTLSALKRDLGA
jgi:6,7-dimethyl-8-ribityllumazine synthase